MNPLTVNSGALRVGPAVRFGVLFIADSPGKLETCRHIRTGLRRCNKKCAIPSRARGLRLPDARIKGTMELRDSHERIKMIVQHSGGGMAGEE